MRFPLPRLKLSQVFCVFSLLITSASLVVANGLNRLDLTEKKPSPDFVPEAAAYTAASPAKSATVAALPLPATPTSRLFLHPANAPWRERALNATIAADRQHALILGFDGAVRAWGKNFQGQTTAPSGAQSGVTALESGRDHNLALREDGTVLAWGGDLFGQSSVPLAAQSGVVGIASDEDQGLALSSAGAVISWDGGFTHTTPTPLSVLSLGPPGDDYRVTLTRAYPSADLSSLANFAGPLTPVFSPSTSTYTQTVSAATAGLTLDLTPTTPSASIQIRVNGGVTQTLLPGTTILLPLSGNDILGLTAQGAITSNSTSISSATNLPVAARADLVSLASANNLAVGLTRDGGLVTWSPGNPTALTVPTALTSGITQIVSGDSDIIILATDGTVRAWTPGNSFFNTLPGNAQTGVKRLASYRNTRLALKTDGSVASWGNISSPPPEASTGIISVFAGDGVAFTQKSDGSLAIWGNFHPALSPIPAAVQSGQVVALVADYYSAQALLADGSVISWGDTNLISLIPPTAARTGVVALAANNDGTRIAQRADGSAVRWNVNNHAAAESFFLQLTPPRSAPIPLRYGANRVSLRITPLGRTFSDAPISTDARWHYAVNQQGAVVYRPATSSFSSSLSIPTEAQSDVTAVHSGSYDDYALTSTGRLVSLSGTFIPSSAQPSPMGQTPVVAPIASVAVSSDSAILLRTDGTTQLLGSQSPQLPLDAQSDIAAIAAGGSHTLLLRKDGRVFARRSFNYPEITIPVAAQSDVIAIAAATNRSLALKADGSVIAWGSNLTTPVPTEAQFGVIGIALNSTQALVLKNDGSVFAWGADAAAYPPPSTVSSGVIALFAAGRQQVALKADGSTVTWGTSSGGGGTLTPADFGTLLLAAPVREYHLTITRQLPPPGLTHLTASAQAPTPSFSSDSFSYSLPDLPYPALALHGLSLLPGDEISVRVGNGPLARRFPGPTLAATINTLLALRPDGSVSALGGSAPVATIPTSAQSGVVALAAGYNHAFALKQDGSLIGWGSNSYNQLSTLPLANDFVAIASGLYHGLAIRRDGSVVAWGRDSTSPQTIPPDAQSGVIAIAAGKVHYIALRSDGRVVQWGYGSYARDVPPRRFVAIAASGGTNLGLRPNGEIATWGDIFPNDPELTYPLAAYSNVASFTIGPGFAATQHPDGSLQVIPGYGQTSYTFPPAPSNSSPDLAGPFAQPLFSRVPLAVGANTVEVKVSRPDSATPSSTYAINVNRITAPDYRFDYDYSHYNAMQRIGTTSPDWPLTLTNIGDADLVITSVDKLGLAAAGFTVSDLSLPFTLAPDASTTLTVNFTPAEADFTGGFLTFTGNQPDNETFSHPLIAEGVSHPENYSFWRTTQFSSAELADPALETTVWGDLADPDHDGIPNLLEYGTATDAKKANASPAPITLDTDAPGGPRLALTYQRRIRAKAGGVLFQVEWSGSLAPDSWATTGVTETGTGIMNEIETVVASVPLGPTARFLRLRVTAP